MKKQTSFIDRVMKSLAMFGLGQALGIPFVGAIVSGFLDVVAGSAAVASDAVATYSNADEALNMMRMQEASGAVPTHWNQAPDGSIEVQYDVSGYTGESIDADALDMLGEWL